MEPAVSVASADALAELARQAGFDLCGFSRPEPIPAEHLMAWLQAGWAADMDWMEVRAADRLDVRRLLPTARTVVSLACNYFHPDAPEPQGPSPVARYARGRDYHATLKDRLRAFRRALTVRFPALESYGSVDTGPVMEKVWAARGGLGYVGRNGCFISERFGSYVLLATLIIDLEVDRYAAGPAADRCGSCRLCVDACPTLALDGEGRVDAGKCLSYQTIENAGQPAPVDLRAAFEQVVFGCDICQDVCPLNDAPLRADARFAPRPLSALSVRDFAALTEEQYQALIPGSPLARAQRDGLRRNAAYALGAARDAGARSTLEALLADPSERVREAAQWALAQLPPS